MTRAAILYRGFASMCLLSGLLLAGPAQADTPPETVTEIDPIYIPPEHDPLAHAFRRLDDRGGFYLRASTNLGYNTTRLGAGPGDNGGHLRVDGFGTAFGVDLGGFVQPWLALHLDSTIGVLWNGNVDLNELAI